MRFATKMLLAARHSWFEIKGLAKDEWAQLIDRLSDTNIQIVVEIADEID